MKQIDKIRAMPAEELAELLVHEVTELEYDYDWDENPTEPWEEPYYVCPDGESFWRDEEGAIRHTIAWLNSEVNKE